MADNIFVDSTGNAIYPGAEVVVAVKQGWDIALRKGKVYRCSFTGGGKRASIGITLDSGAPQTYYTPRNFIVVG